MCTASKLQLAALTTQNALCFFSQLERAQTARAVRVKGKRRAVLLVQLAAAERDTLNQPYRPDHTR
jgi:hypothetical protein